MIIPFKSFFKMMPFFKRVANIDAETGKKNFLFSFFLTYGQGMIFF